MYANVTFCYVCYVSLQMLRFVTRERGVRQRWCVFWRSDCVFSRTYRQTACFRAPTVKLCIFTHLWQAGRGAMKNCIVLLRFVTCLTWCVFWRRDCVIFTYSLSNYVIFTHSTPSYVIFTHSLSICVFSRTYCVFSRTTVKRTQAFALLSPSPNLRLRLIFATNSSRFPQAHNLRQIFA